MNRSKASDDELITRLIGLQDEVSCIDDQLTLATEAEREDRSWLHGAHYALRKKKHEKRCIEAEIGSRKRKNKKKNSEAINFVLAAKNILPTETYKEILRQSKLLAEPEPQPFQNH